ncbi:hypothetical protein OQ279_13680 [Salinimicrobium sp. MT39]|jgi:hypothetical protein|uniref:Lipoprotein n=1 Tax=Salinimicrobium profundisediminis TaxID=2994553 RepID=A0A9X3D0V9_9FLAO|nr:hypothetical protein [Salinimicrobium profundisediminis]MCX2839199.1 hypothetical protein [Salinimicrobium profundisediminis]
MKSFKILPLLTVLILFTSCVEKITRVVHQDTIPPEYTVAQETLKSRISAVIPAENISIGSSKTEKTGDAEYHALTVEIQPETLPGNVVSFFKMTGEIKNAVESGIGNMEDYQKLEIVVRKTTNENGVEKTQSYKKEIDL